MNGAKTRAELARVAKELAERPFHGYVDGKEPNFQPLVDLFPGGTSTKPTACGAPRSSTTAALERASTFHAAPNVSSPAVSRAASPGRNSRLTTAASSTTAATGRLSPKRATSSSTTTSSATRNTTTSEWCSRSGTACSKRRRATSSTGTRRASSRGRSTSTYARTSAYPTATLTSKSPTKEYKKAAIHER